MSLNNCINSTDESIPVGGGGGTSSLAESRMVAFQSTDMADASEPLSMSPSVRQDLQRKQDGYDDGLQRNRMTTMQWPVDDSIRPWTIPWSYLISHHKGASIKYVRTEGEAGEGAQKRT